VVTFSYYENLIRIKAMEYSFYALDRNKKKINLRNLEQAKSFLKRKCGVIVLENFYCKQDLLEARKFVHNWGIHSPSSNKSIKSYHRIDLNHNKSHFSHIFHYYILRSDEHVKHADPLFQVALNKISPIAQKMLKVQNIFLDETSKYRKGKSLLYQVIHYPVGGGYFSSHDHDPKVQNIGLILSLSNNIENTTNEGLYFYIEKNKVFMNKFNSLGNLIIFPYDVMHGVAPISPSKKLDWYSSKGKWSLILPYL